MDELTLSDEQLIRFESRVLPHMEVITRSSMAEHEKLLAIGHIVRGTIDDLRSTYFERRSVQPSMLPEHDDLTIDRLAQWQRALRKDPRLSTNARSFALERLEHGELLIQQSERPKQVLVDDSDDDAPEPLLPWFAQGGE